MFTRFSTTTHRPPVPVVGTVVSLMVHTALVVAAVGGDLSEAGRGVMHGAAMGGAGGERVHWVGTVGGDAHTSRTGATPPIAYVIPGRGAAVRVREGIPTVDRAGRRTRAPAGGDGTPLGDAQLQAIQRAAHRRAALRLPFLGPLPALPELDETVLVPGVIAAAPDPVRLVSRADDFRRYDATDMNAAAVGDIRADVLHATSRVDEMPIALVSNPLPHYPMSLERAHVGGRVVVEFMIDSAGTVDLASLRVLQSTNALFTDAVRSVLPRMRFVPAQLGEHTIGVTVRQPFLFTVRPGA